MFKTTWRDITNDYDYIFPFVLCILCRDMKTYKPMKQLVAVCVLLFKCGRVVNADRLTR